MELWAHINTKDYPINLGCTLNDNIGEELDSMSILLTHIPDLTIKPYDDVYIHNIAPNSDGSSNFTIREHNRIHKLSDGEFYRHFVVFDYTRTELNQLSGLYNYDISLVSETKYLEKVLMPNRTITIPFEHEGKSVFWMAKHFVNRYSPKRKITEDGIVWRNEPKFIVSENAYFDSDDKAEIAKRNLLIVEDVFSDIQAAEMSFNNPTLREALTKIFQVKNCIPVVFDGFIFARNISKKGKQISDIEGKIWDTEAMSGNEYCDRLRKTYSSGLTDKNGIVFHEYVGFRNINVPSIRFSDLKIELKNPIYKINKFYICYYSKSNKGKISKIDATSFVLPSSTRAFLSNNYLAYEQNPPITINGYVNPQGKYVLGACDYKFMTVEYSIGSNEITGFGETVKYTTNGIDYVQKTVFENLLNVAIADALVGEEIYDLQNDLVADFFGRKDDAIQKDSLAPLPDVDWYVGIQNVIATLFSQSGDSYVTNASLRMKSVFFEIEYQGMVSSPVVVSKDLHDGDIYALDYQQESLAITESDGKVSKYKANRLGNKTSTVTARVLNFDDLVSVGDYDERHGICYKRTISLEKDFISANYTFARDYVLMNYFTSVFSKYRSSAYASFEQSVSRDEINYLQLYLSKDELYKYKQSDVFTYSIDLSDIFSVFQDSDSIPKKSIGFFGLKAPIPGEYAYDMYSEDQIAYQYYASDRAYFMSGNSLCCQIGMPDSETSGTYIRQMFPPMTNLLKLALNNTVSADSADSYAFYSQKDSPINDITGAAQGYLTLPSSRSDGSLSDITFGLSYNDDILDDEYSANRENQESVVRTLYDTKLNWQPRLNEPSYTTTIQAPATGEEITITVDSQIEKHLNEKEDNIIRTFEEYKDAKEILNETYEIDPVCVKDGISFSPYMLKLSNIFNQTKERRLSEKEIEPSDIDKEIILATDQLVTRPYSGNLENFVIHSLAIFPRKGDNDLSLFKEWISDGGIINKTITYGPTQIIKGASPCFPGLAAEGSKLEVTLHRVKSYDVSEDSIIVEMSMKATFPKENPLYPSDNLPHNDSTPEYTEIKCENFDVKWRRSDSIKSIVSDQFYPFSSSLYPNSSYNAYNAFYDLDDGKQYLKLARKTIPFSFNFDSFPFNTNLNAKVLDADENEISKTIMATDYNPFIRLSTDNSYGSKDISLTYFYLGHYSYASWSGMANYDHRATALITYISTNIKEYLHPNVFWFTYPKAMSESFDKEKTYSSISDMNADGFKAAVLQSDSEADDEKSYIYAHIRSIAFSPSPSSYSLCLYYLDKDEKYHFVFGCTADESEVFMNSGILTLDLNAKVYASLIEDRSRTVYDADTMEPTYETHNYFGDEEGFSEDSYKVDAK